MQIFINFFFTKKNQQYWQYVMSTVNVLRLLQITEQNVSSLLDKLKILFPDGVSLVLFQEMEFNFYSNSTYPNAIYRNIKYMSGIRTSHTSVYIFKSFPNWVLWD